MPLYVGFTYVSQQKRGQKGLLIVLGSLTGLMGFPVLPTALDMSAETTYPISAGLTSAILWCGSQVCAAAAALSIALHSITLVYSLHATCSNTPVPLAKAHS